MTREELVAKVAEKTGISKKEAQEAVTALFAVLQDALAAGDSVAIKGFGTFAASERAARTGLNPQTKEKIEIAARRAPTFKAGKGLKDAVGNGK